MKRESASRDPRPETKKTMANLDFLAEQGTVAAIDAAQEARRKPRLRLGLSQAGHPCGRCLWYRHHGYATPTPEGRILRLFALGDAVENLIIGELNDAGCQVFHQQQKVELRWGGEAKLVGHIDGKVRGLRESPETTHLLECKSASKKKFDELLRLQDYAQWNEVYGWQVQFYMLGLHLKRAAAIVYCKDDSRLYMERIQLNKKATVERLTWVFHQITEAEPPERLCRRPDDFRAKWCDFYQECFKQTGEAVAW